MGRADLVSLMRELEVVQQQQTEEEHRLRSCGRYTPAVPIPQQSGEGGAHVGGGSDNVQNIINVLFTVC